MRLPIAVSLESRDGSIRKDALTKNALIEVVGQDANGAPMMKLRKRPGVVLQGTIAAGTAQLLYSWNGLQAVIGDHLYSGTVTTIVASPSGTNLSPTNAGLSFTAQETSNEAATPRLMLKNRTQAWTLKRDGSISSVTYGGSMGSSTYNVTSLTRVGTVATATLPQDPDFLVGASVTVAGAAQPAYNGAQTITSVTPAVFTPERSIAITSLTRSGTTATAVATAHGLTNGGSYAISGAGDSAYNGTFTITVVDANTFTYTVTVTTPSAITGTWNPADKSSLITLSGGNLTATYTSSSGNGLVRGTVSKSSGFWAWEITVGSVVPLIGIAKSTTPTNTFVGADAGSYGYDPLFAQKQHGGAGVSYGTGAGTGDVIGVVVDFSAGTLTFFKNGVSMGVAYTGISGTFFPAVNNGVSTARFTGLVYNYSSPASPATGTIKVVDPAVSTPASVTFTVAGSPATPATGTITIQGNGGTVPGIPYINGYLCVMDVNGVIWNSDLDDPTSWPALGFIIAQSVNGSGQALVQSGNYLVALKDWSAEFFYDAKKSPGSPFDLVDPAFVNVGCASGDTAIEVNGVPIWVSQTREQPSRAVTLLSGLTPQKVSSLDVERILNADDLVGALAMPSNFNGHPVYILTLPTSAITLIYDFISKTWGTMSSLDIGSPVSVTSITFDSTTGLATVTATNHGFGDGDPVTIAGAVQNEYNATFPALLIDANTFNVPVDGNPATATGTITATGYTENYLRANRIASHLGHQFALHESAGLLLQLATNVYQDATSPINTFSRSARLDGGGLQRKTLASLRVIADSLDDVVLVRWSDDDCETFSAYRRIDLSQERPELRKNGRFMRRTFELKHIGNNPINLSAYELDIR